MCAIVIWVVEFPSEGYRIIERFLAKNQYVFHKEFMGSFNNYVDRILPFFDLCNFVSYLWKLDDPY